MNGPIVVGVDGSEQARDAVALARVMGSCLDRPVLLAESATLDLLALGSRGYGTMRRVGAGTVSLGVLRGAACPILILPRGVDDPFGYADRRAGEGGRTETQATLPSAAGGVGGDRR